MTDQPLKVCLLGGGFHSGNGVAALTCGIIRSILHGNPRAEIVLVEYSKEPAEFDLTMNNRSIRIRLVNIRFSKWVYLPNSIVRLLVTVLSLKGLPSSIREALTKRNPWLRDLDEAHLVASIAGGDSFSDIYGVARFLYVTLPQILTIWMGKKLVILPQTIGPYNARVTQWMARYVLSRAERIYARDHEGLSMVRNMQHGQKVIKEAQFCYDVAFVMEPVRPQRSLPAGVESTEVSEHCRVGLNVSGLLSMGGYNRRNMFQLRVDYDELLRDIIQLILGFRNTSVILIPHVIGPGPESDSVACERLYTDLKSQHAGRLELITGDYDAAEIKYIIGQCGFFIGSRMHACIAALSQCVPTIAVAYSDKFIGVMNTLNADLSVADPRQMDSKQMLKLIEEGFQRRGAVRQRLENTIPQIKKHVFTTFDDLCNPKSKES